MRNFMQYVRQIIFRIYHKMSKLFCILASLAIFGISVIFGVEEQIRQCSCEEQQKCIAEMKQEVERCLDECKLTVDLKSVIDTESSQNWGICIEKPKLVTFEFFDCLHSEDNLKDSCLKGNESENESNMLEFTDFDAISLKYIRPMAEKSLNKFQELGKGLKIEFVDMAFQLNKCSQDCTFKKLETLQCLKKLKCTLKVDDQEVKEIVNKCVEEMGTKNQTIEICECFQNNGVKNLAPFCRKLKNAKFPLEVDD